MVSVGVRVKLSISYTVYCVHIVGRVYSIVNLHIMKILTDRLINTNK